MQLHKIHRVQKHPALCVIVIVQRDKGLSSYLWDSWGRVGGGWDGGGRGRILQRRSAFSGESDG